MSKRLDDLENSYLKIFEKYGDPNEHIEKYQELISKSDSKNPKGKLDIIKTLYRGMEKGTLREFLIGQYRDVKISYDGNETALLNIIDQQKRTKDGPSMIYITGN